MRGEREITKWKGQGKVKSSEEGGNCSKWCEKHMRDVRREIRRRRRLRQYDFSFLVLFRLLYQLLFPNAHANRRASTSSSRRIMLCPVFVLLSLSDGSTGPQDQSQKEERGCVEFSFHGITKSGMA